MYIFGHSIGRSEPAFLGNTLNEKQGYNRNRYILSKHVSLSINPCEAKCPTNIFCVADSKTTPIRSFFSPNIEQHNSSYIIFDIDHEIEGRYSEELRTVGYDIVNLDLQDTSRSVRYNPFAYVKRQEDIYAISNAMTSATHEFDRDPVYSEYNDKIAKDIYTVALSYVNEFCDEKTLENVIQVISNIPELKDTDPYIKRWYEKTSGEVGNKIINLLIYAESRIKELVLKNYKTLTSTNELNFRTIGEKKTAVFVNMSDSHIGNILAQIFLTQLYRYLYSNKPREHITIMIPHFTDYGKIYNLSEMLAVSSLKNISFLLHCQAIEKMLEKYNGLESQCIVINCGGKLIFGTPDSATVKWLNNYYKPSLKIYDLLNDEALVCIAHEPQVVDKLYYETL